MANVLIAYDNRIDEATLSGSTWTTALPLSNLQDKILTKVARASGLSTQLIATWPRPIPIRLVGLIRHNLTALSKIRITLENADGELNKTRSPYWPASPNDWKSAHIGRRFPLRSWEDQDFICGEPRDTARSRFSRISHFDLGKTYSVKRLTIELNDAASTTTKYIQIGRLFVGKAWSPEINYGSGAKIWYENITDKRRALGGTLYTDLRANFRVIQFGLGFLTEDEALGLGLDMQKTIGDSDECLVNLDPDNINFKNQITLMGRVRQLSPLEQSARIDYPWSTGYEIEEIV